MTDRVSLPRRHRRRADLPPLESQLLRDVREAFARLPWVVCWRNNTGLLPDATGRLVRFGLCEGSSDLVGIVSARGVLARREASSFVGGSPLSLGLFFALELKQKGKHPTLQQLRFLNLVTKAGGAARWTDSVDDAVRWITAVHEGET